MTLEVEEVNFGVAFLSKLIDWMAANLYPGDIFSATELEEWALDNGFEKREIEYIIGRR